MLAFADVATLLARACAPVLLVAAIAVGRVVPFASLGRLARALALAVRDLLLRLVAHSRVPATTCARTHCLRGPKRRRSSTLFEP